MSLLFRKNGNNRYPDLHICHQMFGNLADERQMFYHYPNQRKEYNPYENRDELSDSFGDAL